MLVPLKINDEIGTYILDSGSPSLILNATDIEGHETFISVNKKLKADATTVENVKFGPIAIDNVQAWRMDLGYVEDKIQRSIDGIIGADIIKQKDIMVDYKNREIIFSDDAIGPFKFECRGAKVIPLSFDIANENLPVIRLKVGDKMKRLAFDTGSGINVLHSKFQDDRPTIFSVSSDHLKIDQASFIQADLSDLTYDSKQQLDGIISAYSLNADHIYISYSRKTIYLFYEHELVSM